MTTAASIWENGVFVGLVLPVLPALLVFIVVAVTLRQERSVIVRAWVPWVCGVAIYILLVLLLQKAGVQP